MQKYSAPPDSHSVPEKQDLCVHLTESTHVNGLPRHNDTGEGDPEVDGLVGRGQAEVTGHGSPARLRGPVILSVRSFTEANTATVGRISFTVATLRTETWTQHFDLCPFPIG